MRRPTFEAASREGKEEDARWVRVSGLREENGVGGYFGLTVLPPSTMVRAQPSAGNDVGVDVRRALTWTSSRPSSEELFVQVQRY